MPKDDTALGIALVAGTIGALLGAYAATHAACPVCKKWIRKGIAQCPFCYSYLNWS